VQGLTPEQLYESLAQATGTYQAFNPQNAFVFGNTPQGEFAETFADDGATKTERETTILQALALMNGTEITQATALDSSRTLSAVTSASFLPTDQKIATLYLAALSRAPRPDELERLTAYVQSGGPKKDANQALSDIFWALLNSSEFLMNH
jgi:hypothetical protein